MPRRASVRRRALPARSSAVLSRRIFVLAPASSPIQENMGLAQRCLELLVLGLQLALASRTTPTALGQAVASGVEEQPLPSGEPSAQTPRPDGPQPPLTARRAARSTRRAASPQDSSSMPWPSLVSFIRLKPEPVQPTMTRDKTHQPNHPGHHHRRARRRRNNRGTSQRSQGQHQRHPVVGIPPQLTRDPESWPASLARGKAWLGSIMARQGITKRDSPDRSRGRRPRVTHPGGVALHIINPP